MNIIKEWNGTTIRFRESDQYGCLTDMAKATGKRVNNWTQLQTTKDYLNSLSGVTGIPVTDLLETIQGGIAEQQGTWAHKRVCIRFAQWCNSDLAVQVDTWVEELLLNGFVSISNLTPAQMLLKQAEFMVETERRQKELEERQLLLEESNKETKAIALEAKQGLSDVRNQLASLKEFAVAQPPGLAQDQADLINQAFQLLGATLLEAGIVNSKQKAYSTPWTELGLTMRNSEMNYDLNARYKNRLKKYNSDLKAWEEAGKPRGSKPKKPSRISIMISDSVISEGFKAAQQVVNKMLGKVSK